LDSDESSKNEYVIDEIPDLPPSPWEISEEPQPPIEPTDIERIKSEVEKLRENPPPQRQTYDSEQIIDVEKDQFNDFDFDIVDEREATHVEGKFGESLVTYKHGEKLLAVPMRWYWGNVVKRMINHNKTHGFTGCVLIGMSGSGKTTLTQTILHKIHDYGENYVFKWFNGHQMLEIDKHISSLQVGVPHVMVFDDASYTLEDAKKETIAKLANAMTTIRHHVKSRVIAIFNIHYSRATKKFFRNQHFTFLTSITTEELGNMKDLFQDKMPAIRQFAKKYRQMALNGHFYMPMSIHDSRVIRYNINDPFRIGMVSEITDLHFFVYPRQVCDQCSPNQVKYEEKTTKEIITMLKQYKNQPSLLTTLGFWLKTHNYDMGFDPLKGAHKSYWNFLNKLAQTYKVPWNEVYEALQAKNPKRKSRQIKMNVDVFDDVLQSSEPNVKKKYKKDKGLDPANFDKHDPNLADSKPNEQTKSDNNKPFYPDYDSTYIAPP
jgi:ABC-type dipeptide/oligopeptide/nickel transport system ATPase component